jgi:hypothetical protein
MGNAFACWYNNLSTSAKGTKKLMVQAILRVYSYIFHILLAVASLALSTVAAMSEHASLDIPFFPWSGESLVKWLFALGFLGLFSVYAAWKGILRVIFLLWTVVVAGIVARGIFASGHQFEGVEDFRWALFFLLGVLATILGAYSRVRQPLGKR